MKVLVMFFGSITLALPSLLVAQSVEFPSGVCSIHDHSCQWDDNILLLVPHTSSSAQCQQLCQDESGCTYFTYYGSSSFPFSSECVLFSQCPSMEQCTDCV